MENKVRDKFSNSVYEMPRNYLLASFFFCFEQLPFLLLNRTISSIKKLLLCYREQHYSEELFPHQKKKKNILNFNDYIVPIKIKNKTIVYR